MSSAARRGVRTRAQAELQEAAAIDASAPASTHHSDEDDYISNEEMKHHDEDRSDSQGSSDVASANEQKRLSIRELTAIVQALKDLKWTSHMVCEVFLRKLEAQLKAYTVPRRDWFRVLVLLFSDDINAQEWVREKVAEAEPRPTWQEAKIILISHFETADYDETLKQNYLSCRQSVSETVQMYGDRFRYLCDQLGYADDNEVVINHFLSRMHPRIYAKYLEFKADMQMQHGNWVMTSLHEAVKICIKLDVKNRTVQQAISSSHTSSSANSGFGIRTDSYQASSKRMKLFCKWHPNSHTHTSAECRLGRTNTLSNRPGGHVLGTGPVSSAHTAAVRRLTQELSDTDSRRLSFRPPSHLTRTSVTSALGRQPPNYNYSNRGDGANRFNAGPNNGRNALRCYSCGGEGHYANECPKRLSATGAAPPNGQPSQQSAPRTQFGSNSASSSSMIMASGPRPQAFRPAVRAMSMSQSRSSDGQARAAARAFYTIRRRGYAPNHISNTRLTQSTTAATNLHTARAATRTSARHGDSALTVFDH